MISGCNFNAEINSKKIDKYNCPESVAQDRANFIKTCVTEFKDSIVKCEDLSERLYCSEHKVKNELQKPN